MAYLIECLVRRDDEDERVVMPMIFHDKASALANACALIKSGVPVAKIMGPNFEMRRIALEAYYRAESDKRPLRASASWAWW